MSDGQHPGMLKAWWSAVAVLEVLLAIIVFAVPDVRTWLEDHAWPGAWIVAAILLPIALGSSGTAYARGRLLRAVDHVDVEQYALFRSTLPTTQGTVDFLDNFDGKRWSNAQLAPLENAARDWQHWQFSNKKVAEAFQVFYRAQSDFINWTSFKGFTDDSGAGRGWFTIDYNPASESSKQVRREGLSKAEALRDSIIEFERIGRLEGLRSA
jgi:hypothetical protein